MEVEGVSGGEGERGMEMRKRNGRARMPEALMTLKTGSVFSDRDLKRCYASKS